LKQAGVKAVSGSPEEKKILINILGFQVRDFSWASDLGAGTVPTGAH
jgi:hypothetical protein